MLLLAELSNMSRISICSLYMVPYMYFAFVSLPLYDFRLRFLPVRGEGCLRDDNGYDVQEYFSKCMISHRFPVPLTTTSYYSIYFVNLLCVVSCGQYMKPRPLCEDTFMDVAGIIALCRSLFY